LNFERAVIVRDSSSPYYPYAVYASNALPGWTAVGLFYPDDLLYDDISLGETAVTLCGTNSPYSPSALDLDGKFSILLYGGTGGQGPGASITQTGFVPQNVLSIRFIAQAGGNRCRVSRPFGTYRPSCAGYPKLKHWAIVKSSLRDERQILVALPSPGPSSGAATSDHPNRATWLAAPEDG